MLDFLYTKFHVHTFPGCGEIKFYFFSLRKLLGRRLKGLTVSTFHSACVGILRAEIEPLGYGKNFTIYDDNNQQSLMRRILRDIDGAGSSRSVRDVLTKIADRRLATHSPSVPAVASDEANQDAESAAEEAFVESANEHYRRELKARNAVDFDDLIELTVRLLREHKDVLQRWRERFQFLLVDEYQDTNLAQDKVIPYGGVASVTLDATTGGV